MNQLAVEVADFADESFEFCQHAAPLSPMRLQAAVGQETGSRVGAAANEAH